MATLSKRGGLMALFRKRTEPETVIVNSVEFTPVRTALAVAVPPPEPTPEPEIVLPPLSRQAILAPGGVDLDSELFKKAQALLGYSPVQKAQYDVEKAFREIGYEPLETRAVYQYMRVARAKAYVDARKRSGSVAYWYQWEHRALELYKLPVPEFVLSHAIALKERLPEATFEVHSLQEFHDPFLSMTYKGVQVFVDVWNEPDFEGRKTI